MKLSGFPLCGVTFRLLIALSLLVACAPQTQQKISSQTPAESTISPVQFPSKYYQQALINGQEILRVDAARSLVTIEVHRGGVFAKMGHNHMVASHHVAGYVAVDDGRADIYVPLEKLSVDEAVLRQGAAFDTQPSADAIEGTRNNMLTKVLEVDRFPFALIQIVRMERDSLAMKLKVLITLHGMTRTLDIPANMEKIADGIVVNGALAFNQTDFGIVPFSVLGGALKVEDNVDLRFSIVAIKMSHSN